MELKRRRRTVNENIVKLLIVPYGIETKRELRSLKIPLPFNRTLWN